MGIIRVKYLVPKRRKGRDMFYWQPKAKYFVAGEWVKCPFKAKRLARDTDNAEDAAIEAKALNEHLAAWQQGLESPSPAKFSVHWLATEFYKDEMYLSLSKKSQREYKRIIEKEILSIFVDIPCKEVTRLQARAFYHALRSKPRLAEYTMMVARRLFHYGRNIGVIQENPFTEMGVKRVKPREQIWSDEQINAFLAKALEMGKRSMWLSMLIGSTIGTDTSTTRLLAWSNYDGKALRYARGKTGVKVAIPLLELQMLKAAIDATPRSATQVIVSESTNKPYSEFHFCDVFRQVANAADIPKELQFKDLRRTAVVKLALAGCSVPEIASITGWEPKYCTQIIRHYLPTTQEAAGNAIAKLVKKDGANA